MLRRNHRWWRLPFRAAIVIAALILAAWAATRLLFSGDEIAVVGLIIAAIALSLQASEVMRAARGDPQLTTAQLADSLAVVLEEDWREESNSRRLRSPHVLPLAWAETQRTHLADNLVSTKTPSSLVRRQRFSGHIGRDFDAATLELAKAYSVVPGRRVVIIGQPGAGKSVLAIILLLGLLQTRSPGRAVPVFLSISTWDPLLQDFNTWITQSLATAYYNAELEAPTRLLRDNLVIPILDGLDEMPEEGRRAAVREINRAIGSDQALVLTSRSAEYEDLIAGGAPALRHAPVIEVLPVSADAAIVYLQSIDWPVETSWTAVVEQLQAVPDSQIGRALSTPLMLGLARAVYERLGGDPSELLDENKFDSQHSIEEYLTDRVIDAAYAADPHAVEPQRWSSAQARKWLTFIARYMHQYRERDLVWWLISQRVTSQWTAPALSLIGGALFMVGASTWFWYSRPYEGLLQEEQVLQDALSQQVLQDALSLGALLGAVFAIILMITWYATIGRSPSQLSLVQRGSIHRLRRGFAAGMFAAGLASTPVVVYAIALLTVTDTWTLRNSELFIQGMFGALFLCAGFGLSLAAQGWLNAVAEKPQKADPQATLQQDLRSSIVSSLLAALVGLTVFPLAVTGIVAGSLVTKVVTGWAGWPGVASLPALIDARLYDLRAFLGGPWRLAGGFLLPSVVIFFAVFIAHAWPRFILARALLALRRELPFNLPTFLSDARQRDLLRLTAGAYQFRHARLQENLAKSGAPVSLTLSKNRAPNDLFRSRRRRKIIATVMVASAAVAAALLVALPNDTSRSTIVGTYDDAVAWATSRDGLRLAVVSLGRIVVLDLGADSRFVLSADTSAIKHLVFGPDGRTLISRAGDLGSTYTVWNLNTRQPIARNVDWLEFIAAGRTLVAQRGAGSEDETDDAFDLVDIVTGRVIRTIPGRFRETNIVESSPSEIITELQWRTFVAQNLQGEMETVDAITGQSTASLRGPDGEAVLQASMVANGRIIVAPSDSGIMVWDSADLSLVGIFAVSDSPRLHVDPLGRRLAAQTGGKRSVSGDDDTVELWNLETRRLVASFVDPVGYSKPVFSPDGQFLSATALSTSALQVWSTASGKLVAVIPDASSFKFVEREAGGGGPPSSLILTVATNGRYALWDTSGTPLIERIEVTAVLSQHQFNAADRDFGGLVVNERASVLVAMDYPPSSDGGVVRFYNTMSGAEIVAIPVRDVVARASHFSPDGSIFALNLTDRVVLWDVKHGNRIADLTFDGGTFRDPGYGYGPSPINFSPDGGTVAVLRLGEESLRVWEAHTGRLIQTCEGHSGPIADFRYSGDSRTIVTVGADGTVRIWDVVS